MEEALKGNVPEDAQVLYQKSVDPQSGRATKTPIVVKKRALLTGDTIKTAKVNFGNQAGGAHVSLSFDTRGAKVFDRVTAENVKRRLAIVLDDTIYSAPVIQERISGGEAQITGSFTAGGGVRPRDRPAGRVAAGAGQGDPERHRRPLSRARLDP